MQFDLKEIAEKRTALAENEVKQLLKQYGIPTPTYKLVERKEELEEINFPVALKVCSDKILHKTEVGGVKLNIANQEELYKAFQEFRRRFPEEKFLVEEMAKQGVEIIAGLLQDSVFGLSIMVGIGGIFTELYQDATFRIVPIRRYDAQQMLSELRGRKLLEGFRGIEADREAVISLLLSLSQLGEELEDYIDQMDLNPVFVYERGLCVVDAKLILRRPAN